LGLYPGGVVWLSASPQPAVAPVGPNALLAQALRSLVLPAPQIHLNPARFSVVNLATWLWVEPQVWHPMSATASAGSISATAIATPHDVVWEMGDGSSVVCAGPGDPYQANRPAGQQQTYCSYAFRQPSIGQPSNTGDPNDGAFPVTATVTWTITWFAVGAPGGGTLPSLYTTSTVPVRVEQVESIGTTP
jgi:hypothetical protein